MVNAFLSQQNRESGISKMFKVKPGKEVFKDKNFNIFKIVSLTNCKRIKYI